MSTKRASRSHHSSRHQRQKSVTKRWTGKYRSGKDLPDTPRAKGIQERYLNEQGFRVLGQLDSIAQAQSAAVSQVALAWVMARPGITAAIASATSLEQLHELLAATELKLDDRELKTLDDVSE
jgi:aryl-alcohol dehydrogenase-like predicted oxidoreductase